MNWSTSKKYVTAERPKEMKPFKYGREDGQIKRSLLYVGNIYGHDSIISVGAMFTDLDIWKRFAHSGKSRYKYLGSGFAVGDAFVNYDRPLFRVIEKTKHSHRYRELSAEEHKLLAKSIARVKSELRWRKGSWCEDKRRIKYRTPNPRGPYNAKTKKS
jgi:hypothetical protein